MEVVGQDDGSFDIERLIAFYTLEGLAQQGDYSGMIKDGFAFVGD